jgi:hypothetical protein
VRCANEKRQVGSRDVIEPPAPPRPGRNVLDTGMLALSALAPACLAAMRIANVPDAAHDAGVARVLGLDAQPWRALDVATGVLLTAVPLGTLAARVAMGGAIVIGAAGAVLYHITRRLLGACADAPRLGSAVAAIATLSGLTAPAWQSEAAAVGGAVTGAVLVLLPVALLARTPGAAQRQGWAAAALALGLATAQEPLAGVCALGGCAALLTANRMRVRAPNASRAERWTGGEVWRLLGGYFLLGAAPLILAMARTRASGASLISALTDGWAGERGVSMAGSLVGLVASDLGRVTALLALAGLGLAMLVARARPLASALVAIVVLGFASAGVGAPVGPTRFGAPLLAALAAACAIAGVAIQAVVRAVATARVPLARASAAMVLVFALVLPVEGAQESRAQSFPPTGDATAIWDDVAWGALAPRTAVLVTDRRVYARALAARAIGSLRGDIAIVPNVAQVVSAPRSLARDPAMLPLLRDLELVGAPTEESLTVLASARPLAMSYEARWGRAIARHLVPWALLDRFAPEPRGASDRRRGFEAFAPKRDRLIRAAAHDPELADAAARLLSSRALVVAVNGDRDLVQRALDDVRAFSLGP